MLVSDLLTLSTPSVFPPASSEVSSVYPWFAIRVRSNYERTTAALLRGKGLDEFAALYTATRRWSDRIRTLELPLFPGYIFARFDIHRRMPVISTPGVVHIVGSGSTPIPVDDNEIAAIQAVIHSRVPAQPWPFLKAGSRVVVQYGSLTGVEGIILSVKNQLRLVLSISLLQRSISVEIDRDWIRPIS